jgi:NAD(P)-dependent dehydrogenase (short-subunit alcohol dehydrogenase family)
MNIQGHSAIVTGGGSGLGEAVARELARLGAKVAVLDINAANAQRVAADIGGLGLAADICDTASPDSRAGRGRSRPWHVAHRDEHRRHRHGQTRGGQGRPARAAGRL